MPRKSSDYIMDNKNSKIKEVVSNPVSLFKSMQGKYFVGQTEALKVGNGLSAWCGLVNPRNSDVNLYANVFTVSNFSDDYLTAEIWLNTNVPEEASVSHNVSPTNTALKMLPENEVDIRFAELKTMIPKAGVNVYKRIVPPHTTLVGEEDGKFIEKPGGNYVVVVKAQCLKFDKIIVAFGWWEEPRQQHSL
ncbi:MAG: DUF6143 family protein [Clostridium sp.]|nr:DUF6143 family protein [Clostridium sp.]